MNDPKNYTDNHTPLNPPAPETVSERYKSLEAAQKSAKKKYSDTAGGERNIVSTYRQRFDLNVQAQHNIVKGAVQSFASFVTGGLQVESALLQGDIGEQEASIELLRSYMQEQEKSMDKAAQSHAELLRTFDQSYQTYMNTLSGRA